MFSRFLNMPFTTVLCKKVKANNKKEEISFNQQQLTTYADVCLKIRNETLKWRIVKFTRKLTAVFIAV